MNITLQLGIDSKLDAINYVLESIGSVGINSEDQIDSDIDASDADKLIDNVSQKVQANGGAGWWFNREEFHKFSPDPVTGFITVPNNVLGCLVARQMGRPLPINLRGNRMFDAKNVGYDMRTLVDSSGKVPCILIVNLPFEELPSTAKHSIVDQCRLWFVNSKEGDQVKLEALNTEAQRSHVLLMKEDAGQRRHNMLSNGRISNDMVLAGGYNNVR